MGDPINSLSRDCFEPLIGDAIPLSTPNSPSKEGLRIPVQKIIEASGNGGSSPPMPPISLVDAVRRGNCLADLSLIDDDLPKSLGSGGSDSSQSPDPSPPTSPVDDTGSVDSLEDLPPADGDLLKLWQSGGKAPSQAQEPSPLLDNLGDIDQLMQKLQLFSPENLQEKQKKGNVLPPIGQQKIGVPPAEVLRSAGASKSGRRVVFKGKTADGEKLRELLSSKPKEVKCLMALTVAIGLAELHRLGLCHMDVSPKQVEVGTKEDSNDLYGRLVDGGSVVLQGTLRKQTNPDYMESARYPSSIDAVPSDDMWAYGLLLYEFVYGRSAELFSAGTRKFSSRDEKDAAVNMIRQSLSDTDPVDQLIFSLLGPSEQRPTANKTVEALCQYVGAERYRQFVSSSNVDQLLERVFKEDDASFLVLERSILSRETQKSLCSIAYHMALSLDQFHGSNVVHIDVVPEYIHVFRDALSGELSAQLRYSSGCVSVGRHQEPRSRSPEEDMWFFGRTLFELFYGEQENPFQSPIFDDLEVRANDACWKKALQKIKRPSANEPVDQIIHGLLQPPSSRMTAQQVARALQGILKIETAEMLLQGPQNTKEWKERVVIAHEVARDYRERGCQYFLKVLPRYVEIIRDGKTKEIVGARLTGEIQRPQQSVLNVRPPIVENRRFGLFLLSLFYGDDDLESAIDFDRLPAVSDSEWRKVKKEIRRVLTPKTSTKIIDQIIASLIDDKDFSIGDSLGPLQWLLEGRPPDQECLAGGDSHLTLSLAKSLRKKK